MLPSCQFSWLPLAIKDRKYLLSCLGQMLRTSAPPSLSCSNQIPKLGAQQETDEWSNPSSRDATNTTVGLTSLKCLEFSSGLVNLASDLVCSAGGCANSGICKLGLRHPWQTEQHEPDLRSGITKKKLFFGTERCMAPETNRSKFWGASRETLAGEGLLL